MFIVNSAVATMSCLTHVYLSPPPPHLCELGSQLAELTGVSTELAHARERVGTLERLLRDRDSTLSSANDRMEDMHQRCAHAEQGAAEARERLATVARRAEDAEAAISRYTAQLAHAEARYVRCRTSRCFFWFCVALLVLCAFGEVSRVPWSRWPTDVVVGVSGSTGCWAVDAAVALTWRTRSAQRKTVRMQPASKPRPRRLQLRRLPTLRETQPTSWTGKCACVHRWSGSWTLSAAAPWIWRAR